VLRRMKDEDRKKWHLTGRYARANWVFLHYGKEDMPIATCTEDKSDSTFGCDAYVRPVLFDKDSLRFETYVVESYLKQAFWEREHRKDPDDLTAEHTSNKPDDLFIEIGRCRPS